MKWIIPGLISLFSSLIGIGQVHEGMYRGILTRLDGKEVIFNLEIKKERGRTQVHILNDKERLRARDVLVKRDSLLFHMPAFESSFRTRMLPDGRLQGEWVKGTAGNTQYWSFAALPGQPRFYPAKGDATRNITGKWEVTITRSNGTTRPALAELRQEGNRLTGTFLTPSGDYRYLEGIVTGDSLLLSTFDGAHAYTFSASIPDSDRIDNGFFGSGFNGKETWVALRKENVQAPEGEAPVLKEGQSKLDFSFVDLDSNVVSLRDPRFQSKVVIVQVMGSWCPNCLDETKFLSEFYNSRKEKDVEIIALAYEYSTDFQRSRRSLEKFRDLFDVKYPMLITGVPVTDSLRTEKTIPQITPIKSFPTTLFLDRDKNVRAIHSTFYGPGSGVHHERFKEEFFATLGNLLKK